MITRNRFLAIFAAACLCHLIWCDTAHSADGKPLKVGFVYTGSARDAGWNQAHDVGRQYVDNKLKGSVITTSAENIPENSSCERVMEKMVAQGNKVIFATSYGFLEPAIRVAQRHPDVHFMHCGRPVPAGAPKNVGSFFPSDYYKCLYAAGVVAGSMTKTNKMGYIGGHPIPSLLWCMNAFTLGARSVNPKATVRVIWINSWEDPSMEAESAKGLIENNCDVLISNLNTSMTVCKVAEKAKAYSIGTNLASNQLVKEGWLTGQSWNWGPLYVRVIKSIEDNSWKPDDLRPDLKDGYAALAPFGGTVPEPVRKQALTVMTRLKENKLDIFTAPLKDREGKIRLAQGQKADQTWLNNMNWFVPGVEGSLPKK